MSRAVALLVLAALLAFAQADVYLHSPRGANDRCDEKSNNRNNDKRCFNSQNNAAGGYGICDKEMVFYPGTTMAIEWYSQHNCGNGAKLKTDPYNPESVHCNHVLQLGCDFAFAQFAANPESYKLTDGKSLGRPGADQFNTPADDADKFNTFGNTCTQTQPTTAECADAGTGATGNIDQDDPNNPCNANLNGGNTGTFNSNTCKCHKRKKQTYCTHEPEAWWLKCKARERNKGLFTADQDPGNNNGATNTRQEPNSARYGFECPEDKDYWPYWIVNPWIDIAVLTSNVEDCQYYKDNSQNTHDKCECVAAEGASTEEQTEAHSFNQEITCKQGGHQWKCWGKWNLFELDCRQAASQPDNSLAKVDIKGDNADNFDGSHLASYNWVIPESIIPAGKEETRCLVRIRYNISTQEVASDFDVADNYKLEENPVYTYGNGSNEAAVESSMPLRLAINTAQFGRTFQDRTYVFSIKKRPDNLVGKTIHNVNVRGKRGNIAQVRNCYEYDFVPLILSANLGDVVHFQWCMTDYNDNGNAGEGRQGSDRANVVPMSGFDANIHASLNETDTIFSAADLAQLAWLGQTSDKCYTTNEMLTTKKNSGNDPKSCHFLNGVRDENDMPTAYFSYFATIVKTGTFHYITTRNNNFSNRSQKATINVGIPNLKAGQIAGIVIGSVAAVAAIGGLTFFLIKKKGLPSFSNRV